MVAGGQNPSKEGSESPIHGSGKDEMNELHVKYEIGRWSEVMTETKKKTGTSLPSSSSFSSLFLLVLCSSPLSTRQSNDLLSLFFFFSFYLLYLRSYVTSNMMRLCKWVGSLKKNFPQQRSLLNI